MANEPKGMKAAMRGKGMAPKMTGSAAGGLGRIEKSAAVGGKGSAKIKSWKDSRHGIHV
jgi:hypothetical protein